MPFLNYVKVTSNLTDTKIFVWINFLKSTWSWREVDVTLTLTGFGSLFTISTFHNRKEPQHLNSCYFHNFIFKKKSIYREFFVLFLRYVTSRSRQLFPMQIYVCMYMFTGNCRNNDVSFLFSTWLRRDVRISPLSPFYVQFENIRNFLFKKNNNSWSYVEVKFDRI